MKQVITSVSLILSLLALAGSSFAGSSLSHALSSAWKNQQAMHAQLDNRDITMVYGGKDISLKPNLTNGTTVV